MINNNRKDKKHIILDHMLYRLKRLEFIEAIKAFLTYREFYFNIKYVSEKRWIRPQLRRVIKENTEYKETPFGEVPIPPKRELLRRIEKAIYNQIKNVIAIEKQSELEGRQERGITMQNLLDELKGQIQYEG